MPGFLPTFVENHENLARETGRPFRLKRPTIQRFPLAAERGYTAALVAIIKAIRDDIDELLVPELGRISRESGLRGDELREDVKRRENDLLRNAMRRGEVTRPSKCQRCGKAGKVEAHHADYSKATKVKWFCRLCHESAHGRGLDNDPLKKDVADVSAVIEGIKGRITARIDNTHLRALEELVSRYADETSAFSRMQTARQIRRMIGFDAFPQEAGLRNLLNMHLATNAKLITTLSGDYVDKVANSVRRNVQAGARPEVIARGIKKEFNVTMWRARFIARDQTNKLNGDLTRMRQTGLGIEQYVWRTSRDERVRPTHRIKEGNVYSWDDPPADTGHPGQDFNCRCSAEPVLEGVPAKPEDKKQILRGMKAKRAKLRERLGPKGTKIAKESKAEDRLLARKSRPPKPAPTPAPKPAVPLPFVPTPPPAPAPTPAPFVPKSFADIMPKKLSPAAKKAKIEALQAEAAAKKAAEALSVEKAKKALGDMPTGAGPGPVESPFKRSGRSARPVDPDAGDSFDAMAEWVSDSNDRGSVALKYGAKHELGLDGVPFVRRPYEFSDMEMRGARKTARQMYEKTQVELKRGNVFTKRLYRGIREEYKHAGAIESWTTSESVARDFAGPTGKVLVEDVPASRLLNGSTMPHWPSAFSSSENEWMVIR